MAHSMALYLMANSNISVMQPIMYVDDFVCNTRSSAIVNATVINVSVDANADTWALNPLIFSVNFGDPTRIGTTQAIGDHFSLHYGSVAIAAHKQEGYYTPTLHRE